MKMWKLLTLMVAFGFAALTAAPALAGDAKAIPVKEGEAPEPEKQPTMEEVLKDIDKVIGTVTFVADDIKTLTAYWVKASDLLNADEKLVKLKDKNIKEAFDYAITIDAYKKWATENKLDAENYLRRSLRIILQTQKIAMTKEIEDGRKEIAENRKKLEAEKAKMEEADYKGQLANLDAQSKLADEYEKAFKQVADPTEAEKKLLTDNADAIKKAIEDAHKNS